MLSDCSGKAQQPIGTNMRMKPCILVGRTHISCHHDPCFTERFSVLVNSHMRWVHERACTSTACREQWRRAHLARLQRLVQGAIKQDCSTPICPVIVGSASKAVSVSQMMLAQGFHLPAIREPTVPEGSSRLRISLSAAHSVAQVESMLKGLKMCLEVFERDQAACRSKL
jgi:hypothetical protein